MTHSFSDHLAERFADDARALRARADTLAAGPRDAGPNVASSRAMADACDRVSTLFRGLPASDDDALRGALASLDRMTTDERDPQARHVYAGAAVRVRQLLDGGDDLDDDELDADDDDVDDDDLAPDDLEDVP